MKTRRVLAPKRVRDRAKLVKFALLAGAVALGGTLLAWGLDRLVRHLGWKFFRNFPTLILIVTGFAILALLFFGARAYLLGNDTRQSLQRTRMKFRK